MFVGTSAGSVVAARITTSGKSLAELYAEQLEPSSPSAAPHSTLSKVMLLRYGWHLWRAKNPDDFARRMGQLALDAKTETEAERRPAFQKLLGDSPQWPAVPLRITTLHAKTGALRAFDRESGASLLDAVGASAAVPGVWPPVTIQGERYIDGGMRSGTHANLASEKKHIVIIAPLTFGTRVMTSPWAHQKELEAAGAKVALVTPDAAAKKAIGGDVLDPRARVPAARAGHEQAARVREVVAQVIC
ncbi:MAG: patatin-like phospholipase family protein [Archangium sp.]